MLTTRKSIFLVVIVLVNVKIGLSQSFMSGDFLASPPSVLGLYDFDGDLDLDALCTAYGVPNYGEIWWVENHGNNEFNSVHTFVFSYNSGYYSSRDKWIVDDIDLDSDLDIITQGNKLHLLINDGQGNFSLLSSSSNVESFCVADIDNDDQPEIYTSLNLTIKRVDLDQSSLIETVVFQGTSNGYGEKYSEIKSADIDNNNQLDLVYINNDILVGNNTRDYIEAILNTDSPSWTSTVLMSGQTGSSVTSDFEEIKFFELVDSDADGDLDLYFNSLIDNGFGVNSGNINMKLNNGVGVFTQFCDFTTIQNLTSSVMTAYDFNSNSTPDFLSIQRNTQGYATNSKYIDFGCGPSGSIETGYIPYSVDFNLDGHYDLFKEIYEDNVNTTAGESLRDLYICNGDGAGGFSHQDSMRFVNSPYLTISNINRQVIIDFDNNGTSDVLNKLGGAKYQQVLTDTDGLAQSFVIDQTTTWGTTSFWSCANMNGNSYPDFVFVASDAGTSNSPEDIYVINNNAGLLTGAPVLIYDNTSTSLTNYTRGFNIADTDGDGDNDILIFYKRLNQNDGKIYLIRNLGNYNFAAPVAITSAFGEDENAELNVLDYDGDNDVDIFMYGKFFRNNGSNNFTEQYASNIFCASCEVVDIDVDGDLDVVTREEEDGSDLYFFGNDGNFNFSLLQTYSDFNWDYFEEFVVHDFDGDGLNEIILGNKLFKKSTPTDSLFTVIAMTLGTRKITTLPDSRLVSWLRSSNTHSNAISYDFVQSVNCLSFIPTISENYDQLSVSLAGENYQWFDCGTNTAVSGANDAEFEPDSSGLYRVNMSYEGCSLSSSCFSVALIPGDFDSDNDVDLSDLEILLQNYGCENLECFGDMDQNGEVGVSDLFVLIALIQE